MINLRTVVISVRVEIDSCQAHVFIYVRGTVDQCLAIKTRLNELEGWKQIIIFCMFCLMRLHM